MESFAPKPLCSPVLRCPSPPFVATIVEGYANNRRRWPRRPRRHAEATPGAPPVSVQRRSDPASGVTMSASMSCTSLTSSPTPKPAGTTIPTITATALDHPGDHRDHPRLPIVALDVFHDHIDPADDSFAISPTPANFLRFYEV